MPKNQLPVTNDLGYYEIRMESIGGQGANLAGLILTEACVLEMGFNGLNFSSYGSEKKGTPVKVFVRLAPGDREIHDNSPVESPHLLAIFADQMIGTIPMTQGTRRGGTVVVNTPRSPGEISELLKLPGCRVVTVDALKIAMEEKIPLNTAMLGAITRASGFVDKEAVKGVVRGRIERRYPLLVEGNLRAFERGYSEVREEDFCELDRHPEVPFVRAVSPWGYRNAPIGGIVTNPGRTIEKDNTASRLGYAPLWHKDKCIHCGDCDMACPDYCMVFENGTDDKGRPAVFMRGVDYRYCKGCLRCVAACPVDALTAEVEKGLDIPALRADLRRVL